MSAKYFCPMLIPTTSDYWLFVALLSRIEKTVDYRLFVSVVPGYGGENVIVLLAFCGFIIKD